MLATTAVHAEYRLSAFGDAIGYKAIVSGDAEAALAVFDNRNPGRLDSLEHNNLCVAHILNKDFEEAIKHCEQALAKVGSDVSIGRQERRQAKASMYSNLGVAHAMNGNLVAAAADLQMALDADDRNRTARDNSQEVQINLVAGN